MTGKNENVNYKPMFLLSAMFMGIVGSGFMSKDEMPVQNVPTIVQQKESMKLYVDAPVEIAAGDITSIDTIAKTVLSDQVPAMVTPILKEQDGTTSVYQMGDFDVTLDNFDLNKSAEQEIFVSVRKVESGVATKANNLVLTNVNEESSATELKNDVVATYKLKVKVTDDVKPVVEVTQDEDTITEGDEFDAEAYFESATDNVDGDVDHETTSDVDTSTAGTYTVTYTAKDNAGNEGSASVTITVEEKEEEEEVKANNSSSNSNSSYSGAGSNSVSVSGSTVANAALSQIGQYQDCTALATRSLAAAGIYHHGYPASYMSLGTIVSASEAVPGDLIYYANGGTGFAHIAVYIGGGQAVHGGWMGNQTVQYSAYVGSGPVFIHIAR